MAVTRTWKVYGADGHRQMGFGFSKQKTSTKLVLMITPLFILLVTLGKNATRKWKGR